MTETKVITDNKNNLLTYIYNSENLAKVTVTTFSSIDGSIEYNTLTSNSFEALNSVLNPDNTNAQVYGGGGHDNAERNQKKINLWGPRGDNDQPLRNFLVQQDSDESLDQDTLGFVNFGASGMKDINGNPIYEGGALFEAEYNNTPLITTSIDAIYGDYFASLHKDGLLPGGLFIYTIATENPLFVSLLESNSLVRLGTGQVAGETGLDNNGLPGTKAELDYKFGPCISEILATNAKRFNVGDNYYNINESGADKAVFFNLLDESICAVAGEVPVEGSSEL